MPWFSAQTVGRQKCLTIKTSVSVLRGVLILEDQNIFVTTKEIISTLNTKDPLQICFGDGREGLATGTGKVSLDAINVELNIVLYCPEVAVNLISVACLNKRGFR